VPFSSVITDDLNQGRRHMNFEDWEVTADQKNRPPNAYLGFLRK
jgi:hypothetical protein